jgi:hypothetical protein
MSALGHQKTILAAPSDRLSTAITGRTHPRKTPPKQGLLILLFKYLRFGRYISMLVLTGLQMPGSSCTIAVLLGSGFGIGDAKYKGIVLCLFFTKLKRALVNLQG